MLNQILVDLKDYLIYKVQGDNALNFLQGQITNDVLNIEDNKTIPALLCNAQGRILMMLRVLQQQGQVYVIFRQDLENIFQNSLSKVAALSRVKLLRCTDLHAYYKNDFILSNSRLSPTHSYQDWQINRIKKHEFDIYPSTSGLFLPQDLELEQDWISFSKGCYRGQEIIARMHYLGKSKYHLIYSESDNISLQPGDKIDSNAVIIDAVQEGAILHLLLCTKKSN
jgi:folate-binding protein YgfZ